MKKLSLIFLLCALLALPASSAFGETSWATAEDVAQPVGRTVASGNSVLLSVWYGDGTNTRAEWAQVGVSNNCASTQVLLYENGALGSTETRFAGEDNTIDCANRSIKQLVDMINSDTSGYWHAKIGPDAYPDMPAEFISSIIGAGKVSPKAAYTAANVVEADAIDLVLDIGSDLGITNFITCGVRGEAGARVRLKGIVESTRISNQHNSLHTVEVYDGSRLAFVYPYDSTKTCWTDDTADPAASPNTIKFCEDYGAKGLASSVGNGMTVLVRYPTHVSISMGGIDDSATGNVTIVYDIIKP